MPHWTFSAAFGFVILSSGSGSANPAQGVISGIYRVDPDRSDDAFKAIESGTADVSVDKRGRARARLRKSVAVDRMRISIARNRVGIAYDAKAPIVFWIGGEPVNWKLTETFDFVVSAKGNGEAVFLTFSDADNERITTYRSVGHDLVESTTITSRMFATPIIYKRIYNRTN